MIQSFFSRTGNYIHVLCLVSSLFLSHVCFGSSDSLRPGLRIETKIQYGFVYPHHSAIQYLLDGNISGAEITFSSQTFGKQPWEQLFRYPRYGVGYNFTNFGNPDVLGYGHALFGFFDSPLYRSDGIFCLDYQIAFGAGYITRNYEPYTNPMNLAISSHTNVYISVDLEARWKAGKRNEVKAALELSHFSNGKVKSPNLGLNTVNLSASWAFSITPDVDKIKSQAGFEYKKQFFEIACNGGVKRDDMLNEKLYGISTVVADYNYATSPKYAFGGGIDLMYDASLSPTKEYEELTPSDSRDNFQLGAHIGARSRCGRMNVMLNVGHYVYAGYYKYSGVYSRIGFRYMLTDYLFFNMAIKAHYAIADYLEWGIGYRFKTRGL